MKDLGREPEHVKMAPRVVVGRVSLYLRQLEAFQRQGYTTISSSQLGAPLSIKNAQVRKDLACFGQFGHPGVGYRIDDLIGALRRALGIDRDWPLAVIGLGNLGRALLGYRGFRTRRFKIVAIFDSDPAKVGQVYEGLTVEPLENLKKAATSGKIHLGLLCVPAESAQRVADQMVHAGITGILNFAPVPLTVPPQVNVVTVDLSVQLENLAYKVLKGQEGLLARGTLPALVGDR
ncbi:Redox-sensing transcriptional repressor Rex [Aquisphaera giovannonii]|uniref:Redox-sensing transcriptional repressor Rex n=1 Tax=Aquisphaera giovannonii TaxID=406548 RepID=A0A5B9W102_9BACT|nr:redox-sensing transcriptional repressor Rex [Aquisphaera giovannonii]QEH33655.1 Redox-sensing transcriptional repressor Rex [Aquisphaera giovannonii]